MSITDTHQQGAPAPAIETVRNNNLRAALSDARKEEAHLIRRIHNAHQNGLRHNARNLVNLYLNSRNARLCAVCDANRKLRRRDRFPSSALVEIAEQLDPWRGTDELVHVFLRRKASGGYRPVMDFGLRNKAHQILVGRALEPFALVKPFQYAVRGGGRQAAVRDVLTAMRDGYKWAIELDIKNCFASFDERRIAEFLPLPRKVTEAVLVSSHLNLTYNRVRQPHIPSLLVDCRRGLPQGSAASSLVAEVLLAEIFADLPQEARVFVYADNILIMARTKLEAASITETLIAASGQCLAGHLRLVDRSGLHRVCAGFNFLGYWFRNKRGHVYTHATDVNMRGFIAKCWKRLEEIARSRERAKDRKLRSIVNSWRSAFSQWSGAYLWTKIMLAMLADRQFPNLQRVARLAAI